VLDLDTGRAIDLPAEWLDWVERRQWRWFKESGADLQTAIIDGVATCFARNSHFVPIGNDLWTNSPTRSALLRLLAASTNGPSWPEDYKESPAAARSTATDGPLPATFGFLTAEGSVGLFQATAVETNEPCTVNIRGRRLSPER